MDAGLEYSYSKQAVQINAQEVIFPFKITFKV